MTPENPPRRMIAVDALQEQLTIEQLAGFYGFDLGQSRQGGGEQRMRCPCTDCDGHNDDRSVSVNLSGVKPWKCHRENYGCGAKGNLIVLAYCMKYGQMPIGKLTGKPFRETAEDLAKMAGEGGHVDQVNQAATASETSESPAPARRVASQQRTTRRKVETALDQKPNVPLGESENEGSRKIDRLDEKLTVQLEELSPEASGYARRRPFLLSEELAAECRFGYCPSSLKSMVRGKWVYGVMDEQGRSLAWIGRNVSYESEAETTPEAEESKYKFPRVDYFRRGLELYGQEFLSDERFAESLKQHGLILVEGFTDRIRLHELGIMSVAMMSNQLTDAQTHKLISYANKYAGGRVGIMHDADAKGDEGAKESLWRLHNGGVDAYLVWSGESHDQQYRDRQPESISKEEWQVITGGTN